MGSSTVFLPREGAFVSEQFAVSTEEELVKFVEQPSEPSGQYPAARGAITGMLLGATLWGVLLVLTGVVKL